MDSKKIGEFIHELRAEKGLSQYKLADMIPISRQAVSKWERGVTIPDSSTLLRLSVIFDVSIDELLSGERLTKDALKSGIGNTITLSAIDEINKKAKRIKKLNLSIIVIVLFFLIAFLGYYFISSYNSIKVFTVEGETKNFTTTDGIFITTKDKIYFRLGNLMYDQNINIDNFELYYLVDNEKRMVFSSDTYNLLIRDYYGHNAYFDLDNLNKIVNNLYLRISFNGTYEDIHLVLKKDFANNKFFSFKKNSIPSDDNNIDMPIFSSNNNIFEDLGKLNCNDDILCTLTVEENNHEIVYTYIKEPNILNVTDIGGLNHIEWSYFINDGIIDYKVYEQEQEVENITIILDEISVNSENYDFIQNIYDNYIIKHLH